MHGVLFAELKKYVVARLGGKAWNDLLAAAGLPDRVFFPNQIYPDEELVALVTTASRLTNQPAAAILEDFGDFIAEDLLSMYKAQIDPTWKALDLIEHTEQLIHRAVRVKLPGAKPPELVARREGPDRLVLVYSSPRKLCGVAKGLAKGVGRHYGEPVEVSELRCMHQGAPSCDIVIQTGP